MQLPIPISPASNCSWFYKRCKRLQKRHVSGKPGLSQKGTTTRVCVDLLKESEVCAAHVCLDLFGTSVRRCAAATCPKLSLFTLFQTPVPPTRLWHRFSVLAEQTKRYHACPLTLIRWLTRPKIGLESSAPLSLASSLKLLRSVWSLF